MSFLPLCDDLILGIIVAESSCVDAYVIGMAIIGSVILYPYKNMKYIDALFFAAGGATQSGLNT